MAVVSGAAFPKAQQAQDPRVLDTGWLATGHADEFVRLLPADTTRPDGSRTRPRTGVSLRAWLRPAHAEVTWRRARAHHCRFPARLRADGGHLIDGPCPVDPYGDFHISRPVDVVEGLHPGGEVL
ncbi:protein-arginine deiminase family protein [Streptomyces chartreusis]|uniref:protein-arginine deiminase family protein n=1 Tax=Streptomyces chartreusis TaxID=1969 RepID=UPI0033BB553E